MSDFDIESFSDFGKYKAMSVMSVKYACDEHGESVSAIKMEGKLICPKCFNGFVNSDTPIELDDNVIE